MPKSPLPSCTIARHRSPPPRSSTIGVVPFYDEHGIRLSRLLTDRGTEFCGTQSHEYELYLAVEDIDHSRTKTKSPQTTDVIDKQFLCSAEASRFSIPAYPS